MRFFNHSIFVLLIVASCTQTQDQKTAAQNPSDIDSDTSIQLTENVGDFGGISILTTGPRGGRYLSSEGIDFRYTVFGIQISNDTIVPINLALDFPTKPTWLLPDSVVQLKVFLIPEKFASDSIQDAFNFGVRMEEFFELGNDQQLTLDASIPPEQPLILFIGVLYEPELMSGVTRTKLFVEGHDHGAPFYPVKSIERYELTTNSLNLFYGISFDPPNHHVSIPCGQIRIGMD